ncbi:MAG TPA: MFS transporter [Solirubrobacterales bacterium]|nr:MFS transporter [Solirubrobacterales bacterium]
MEAATESRPGAEGREPGESGRNLGLATAAFTICFYAWALLGPLGPDLQEQLDLSDGQIALTISIPVVLGSLMRIPLGVLAARHGGRAVFTALMAFTPLPLLGLALFNDSYGAVLACGLLLGFAGASFAVGVPFVNRWYPPERQGFALGIYGMGMGGTVLGALTAPAIVDATSIAVPFLFAAVLVGAMAVAFWLLAADAPAPAPPPSTMLAALSSFRGRGSGHAWALTLFYFVAFGGFVAMFLYLPKLLVDVHDLTKTDAAARAAGFAVLAVIARPVGGILSDRTGARSILVASFVGTALLALVLAGAYEDMVPLTAACLTLAVFLGLGTGAVFKLVPEWFPQRVGAVTGVVGAAGGLGGFFPPLVMALVKAETGGYALGFVLMAVAAAIALAVITALRGSAAGEAGSRSDSSTAAPVS